MGRKLIIFGGRGKSTAVKLPLEVYDSEQGQWSFYQSINKIRASVWIHESLICSFGGLDLNDLSIPTNNILSFDIKQLNTSTPVKDIKEDKGVTDMLPKIQISSSVEYATTDKRQVKIIPLTKLSEEMKKIGTKGSTLIPISSDSSSNSIADVFISKLLRPKEWIIKPINISEKFEFKKDEVNELVKQCMAIVSTQSVVLEVKSPIKVFGDIHGQYIDLMRFFDLWRAPTEASQGGDIDSFDYLFLGDYVDRGLRSLETICLLMALKIKYPNQIHLLRGNHEDIQINSAFGFAEECADRLDDSTDTATSTFNLINAFFEYLPIAAVIDKSALCIHGGIGYTLHSVEDLKRLKKPIRLEHEAHTIEDQILIDALWSDPTESDDKLGVIPNESRDPNGTGTIVKFGPDKVEQFLKINKLQMILRGHECVMDGIERFAKGQLMTIFSATDYCGKHKNAGAMLVIKKNLSIVPKLIYPSENSSKNWYEDKEGSPSRPHTPPKWMTSHRSFS